MRTRIKICGLTREADLIAAAQAGADAIGFVFYEKSKRFLTLDRAAELRRLVPAFVSVTALFVNASGEFVREVQRRVKPDLLQFHGDESAEQCVAYDHPYLKVFRVGAPGLQTREQLADKTAKFSGAQGWLFDSFTTQYGGSGESFDLTLLQGLSSAVGARPVVLSGGLRVDTVGAAIASAQPWAVDVSSGVETAPGIKSEERIAAFVAAVRAADGVG